MCEFLTLEDLPKALELIKTQNKRSQFVAGSIGCSFMVNWTPCTMIDDFSVAINTCVSIILKRDKNKMILGFIAWKLNLGNMTDGKVSWSEYLAQIQRQWLRFVLLNSSKRSGCCW